MKLLTLTTLSSLLAATVSAAPFPSAYTLVADGGWTVVTDGSMLHNPASVAYPTDTLTTASQCLHRNGRYRKLPHSHP